MRLLKWAALGALALGGCNVTAPETSKVPGRFVLNDTQLALMQTRVRTALKDDSAQFGAYAAATDEEGTVKVCGLVNAKSGSGGHIGIHSVYGHLRRRHLRGRRHRRRSRQRRFALCGVRGSRPSAAEMRSFVLNPFAVLSVTSPPKGDCLSATRQTSSRSSLLGTIEGVQFELPITLLQRTLRRTARRR